MYCTYCQGAGHNRRTCKPYTSYLKRLADAVPESESYRAQYQARLHPQGKKVEHMKCGYCKMTGHTRRKCETLEKDIKSLTNLQKEKVLCASARIEESSIGIGSLFTRSRTVWNKGLYARVKTYYTVVDFKVTLDLTLVPSIIGVCKALQDVPNLNINLKVYDKNPEYGFGTEYQARLLSKANGDFDSESWICANTPTVYKTSLLEHWKRSGSKNTDCRNSFFYTLDRYSMDEIRGLYMSKRWNITSHY